MQNNQVRSFIAAELPKNIKSELDGLQRDFLKKGLNYVKWVNPSGIHLTLKFLGNVDINDLSKITTAIEEGCKGFHKFSIELTGLGVFPNYRKPRVIWVGLEGQLSTLINLQKQIDDRLESLGFPKEKRPFSPHITLGRIRETASPGDLKDCADVIQKMQYTEKHILTVDCIKLMKSQLLPTGAIYTEMAMVKLD
jgi:2'-5' RNA ligase